MTAHTNTIIGYIVDVQGNLFTATLVEDDQGRVPTITVGDEDIIVGQIGSYVAIRQNTVHIIAIVTRMTEQEALAAPTIETPGEDTARLPFAKRIARLTPIGSIQDDGQFDRGGRTISDHGCGGSRCRFIRNRQDVRQVSIERVFCRDRSIASVTKGMPGSIKFVWAAFCYSRSNRSREVLDRPPRSCNVQLP